MGEAVKLKVIKINGTMELEIQLIPGLNIQSRLLRCRRPTTTGVGGQEEDRHTIRHTGGEATPTTHSCIVNVGGWLTGWGAFASLTYR